MALSVGVVYLGRQVSPDATALRVGFLFTTGPDQAVRVTALDWGDGSSSSFAPVSPSFAFVQERSYDPPVLGPFEPIISVASFAAEVLGPPIGFSAFANVRLMLDPDAEAPLSWAVPGFSTDTLIVASVFADTLIGNGSEDTVYGGAGNDFVVLNDGRDAAHGEAGNDTLDGGRGNDFLWGNAGADSLVGGIGNDQLVGGVGADSIAGGAGVDYMLGEDGDDMMDGGAGSDGIFAGNGADTLAGGFGDDDMDGGAGNDLLNGGAGNDNLYGGAGADTLIGGAGGDDFIGGLGGDIIRSGADGLRDVFRYDSTAEGGDTIYGFIRGEDVIQVEFADPGPLLVGRAPVATIPVGTYLFDIRTSQFMFDPDGNGAAAPIHIATLVGVRGFDGGDLFFTF